MRCQPRMLSHLISIPLFFSFMALLSTHTALQLLELTKFLFSCRKYLTRPHTVKIRNKEPTFLRVSLNRFLYKW